MRELRCLAMPQSFQNISMTRVRWDIHIHDSWGPHFRAPATWRLRVKWQSALSWGKPLFWDKSHGKNQSVYSKGSKAKKQLDPLKFGSHETTQPGCNFGQLEKASPRWIWCSFLNFNEPNMEGENETSLKVCSVYFPTYKLRTRPDSSKSRIFDMPQRSSVLKLLNQLKWKSQLRVCVPGSINSLYWR